MKLEEFCRHIEKQGYTLIGSIEPFGVSIVVRAPLCLIPAEPPVEANVVMVPDVLKWDQWIKHGWPVLKGYARIEGAATTTRVAAIHLQFIRRSV